MQDFDWDCLARGKKLSITDVTLYYFDKPGMEPLDFAYPYAELKMEADSGGTNTSTFYLLCPMLSTNALRLDKPPRALNSRDHLTNEIVP